jgi:glycosyltransferase involved in cell wall biosynthesis
VAERPRVLLLGLGWFPPDPGGLNRFVRELVTALGAEGVPVDGVVLGPADDPPPTFSVPALQSDGLATRVWRFARAASAAGAHADVVDAHFALYSFAPVVLGALRARPLVVHFHGPWAQEGAALGEARAKAILKRRAERALYRRAHTLVVLSGAFRQLLVEQYGVSPWAVHVIPPGVDLDRFTPGDRAAARRALGIPSDVPLALTVRRLVPRMGVHVLLEAWARAGGRALLAIAGEGPERAALERRAAALDIFDRVRFIGRLDDEELVRWYRAADLAVVPSTALEGFGLVLLESLACGTPVLGSDAGGLPEALAGLDPSLVVRSGDTDALADRLRGAFDRTAPLPSPERCRQYAEGFTWERTARRTRDLYERAAAGRDSERGIRVAFVTHCARLSGAELMLARLLPALEGVEPHVLLGEGGPLVPRLLRAGISVEVLPLPSSVLDVRRGRVARGRLPVSAAVGTASYVVRLARRLRQLRPDVVHAYSMKAAVYGSVAARLARIPLVVHLHGRLEEEYLPPDAVALLQALLRRLPHTIVANSHSTLATLGQVPGERAVVVYPPILVDGLRARQPASTEEFCVGMVGRIAPWKGQDVFIRAFAAAFPDGKAQARIIGSALFGEDEFERELRQLVRDLGLDARVEFAGFRDDVGEELSHLDALVHASVIQEPFGQVVAEGMAAGLPVVAATPGGPDEIVENGVSGLLYPSGDVGALADRLRRIARDPVLRARLGEAGRRAAERFQPNVVGPALVDVYRRVLAERSR